MIPPVSLRLGPGSDADRTLSRARSTVLNRLFQALGLIAAAAILWLTFRTLDLSQTWGIIRGLGPSALIILLPFLISMVIDTVGWQVLFRHLGLRPPLWPLLGIRLASEGVLLSVSGGGVLSEGVPPYLLHKSWRIPYAKTIATMGVRKALLIFSQGIYIGVGVLLGFEFLRATSPGVIGAPGLEWLMLVTAAGLMGVSWLIIAVLTKGALGARIHRGLGRIRHRWLAPRIEGLRSGLLATDDHLQQAFGRTWRDTAELTAIYFVVWLVEAFETYFILRLLGVEIGFIEVWAFEPALSLLRHLVFFVPAGLGFQDVGYVAFLTAFGVPDPLTVGSAFIVLKRSKELLWAAFGLGLLYFYVRRARAAEATPRPPRPSGGPDVKRVLLICGSIHQTKQMHAVGAKLTNCECWYSPYYGTGFAELGRRLGLLETSIAGSKRAAQCRAWLEAHGAPIDYRGRLNNYDFVITCSDQIVPGNVAGKPMVLIQEGMTDPVGLRFRLHRWVPFLVPRYLAGTGATGQSRLYRKFCVASEGYRAYFVSHGLDPTTIEVTGIPNFDNCIEYADNDFPHRGYTLACTSDGRETSLSSNDRQAFIEKALRIADGQSLIFKLHPNEASGRAQG